MDSLARDTELLGGFSDGVSLRCGFLHVNDTKVTTAVACPSNNKHSRSLQRVVTVLCRELQIKRVVSCLGAITEKERG